MLKCEHEKPETTIAWKLFESEEFWNPSGQVKKMSALPLTFRPTTKCHLELKSHDSSKNKEYYASMMLKIEGEPGNNFVCAIWTQTEDGNIFSGCKDKTYSSELTIVLRIPLEGDVCSKIRCTKCQHCCLQHYQNMVLQQPMLSLYQTSYSYIQSASDLIKKLEEAATNDQILQLRKELNFQESTVAELANYYGKKFENLEVELRNCKNLAKINKKIYAKNADYFDKLWEMRYECHLTDFSFDVFDDMIEAHKSIIAVKSTYFAEQFAINPEKREHKIEGIDSLGVEKMLEFMYLGSIANYDDYAIELYKLAVDFGIADLKTDCIKQMELGMTMQNSPKLLVLSIENGDRELAKAVINFANHNGGREKLLLSDEMTKLVEKNTTLLMKVYKYLRIKNI